MRMFAWCPRDARLSRRRFSGGSLIIFLGVASTALANLGGGCSVKDFTSRPAINAFTQGTQAISLSENDELPMGESVVCAVTSRYPISTDDKLNRYVTLVGLTVASGCPRTDIPFSFVVLETDEVNAYSGPGGFVMVTRGALQRMSDESELAGVLGHEIGHIALRHGFNAVRGALTTSALASAVQAADRHIAQMNFAMDNVVKVVLSEGWAQPQEFEADAAAVQYLIKAKYDPTGFERFLQKLENSGGSLMSTHPGKAERLAKVTAAIDQAGARGKGKTLAERFRANVGQ